MKTNNLIEKRKNQILIAAEELFARDGFSNTSTDKIAELAKLGKGTVYRYFKNKKSLFFSVVDKGLDKLRTAMLTETSKSGNPLSKIEAAIKTYLTFFDKNPSLIDILIHEHSQFNERIHKRYFEHYYGNMDKIRLTFRQGIEKRVIKDLDIEVVIGILTGMLHGLVYKWHADGKKYKLRDKSQTVCKVFFTGIISDKTRRNVYE